MGVLEVLKRKGGRFSNQILQKVQKQPAEIKPDQEESVLCEAELRKFTSRTWVPAGHFYSPIADESYVREHRDRIFRHVPDIPGIVIDMERMRSQYKTFGNVLDTLKIPAQKIEGRRYFFENPAYSYGDAIVYSSFLHSLRPKKVIEVGSGYSSCLLLDVRDELGLSETEITFIEPYPELLKSLIGPDEQKITLIPTPVQEVKTEVFEQLDAGDILFIDSTHVSKVDSDVNHHLFRILPSLKSGVYIHFHDIFYPFEYPSEWLLDENRSWNENYILRAFLMHNNDYEIVFFNSAFVCMADPGEQETCRDFFKNSGGAIWLRKR